MEGQIKQLLEQLGLTSEEFLMLSAGLLGGIQQSGLAGDIAKAKTAVDQILTLIEQAGIQEFVKLLEVVKKDVENTQGAMQEGEEPA